MLTSFMNLLKNSFFRYSLTLFMGLAVGAVFFPSKKVSETVSAKYENTIAEMKSTHEKETSSFKEQISVLSETEKKISSEYEKKVSQLTTQVSELKTKNKTSYYKLIKPDGTIEVKKFSESEVNESNQVITQINEEFKTKVESIEKKWESAHVERVAMIQKQFDEREASYQKTISSMKAQRVTETNKREFGGELGAMTNGNYYGHVQGDIVGPVYVGVHGELGPHPALGLGLGIKF